jgi:ATP-dependent Clp protease protease subunit
MYNKLIVDPNIRAKHTDLLDMPQIISVSKFDEEAVEDFREDLEEAHNTGQPVIPVAIDSYGGSVYGCLNMIGLIQKSTIPVYTIVVGKAMSAGAVLFSIGARRYMAENATLMLHDASLFTYGKTEEIKADAKEVERLNGLVFKIMAKQCGQKDDYFLKLIHEKGHADWHLNAKDAKKHKLCTHIGIPEMKVKISVDYDFG